MIELRTGCENGVGVWGKRRYRDARPFTARENNLRVTYVPPHAYLLALIAHSGHYSRTPPSIACVASSRSRLMRHRLDIHPAF